LSSISPEILGILKNQEILAVNQDPVVGKSISPFRWGINVSAQWSLWIYLLTILTAGLDKQ
jgi:alpha-galactosidase